jgi:hypothetical protein
MMNRFALTIPLLLCLPPSVLAQTASVAGTVTDVTDAVVPQQISKNSNFSCIWDREQAST